MRAILALSGLILAATPTLAAEDLPQPARAFMVCMKSTAEAFEAKHTRAEMVADTSGALKKAFEAEMWTKCAGDDPVLIMVMVRQIGQHARQELSESQGKEANR